jgi:two-component system chemotaxis sensor kinase CheA
VESLRPGQNDIKTLSEKGEVLNARGEYIPLIRLHEILGIAPWKKDPWNAIVIVTMHEGKKYSLLVDELLGEQPVVIKNLGTAMPKLQDIAGGTILGDGRVALVLDVPGIVETAKAGN